MTVEKALFRDKEEVTVLRDVGDGLNIIVDFDGYEFPAEITDLTKFWIEED